LCVYQAATGDTAAVKVSDLMSYERLRSTAIYSDWYALGCVRDEIEVGISPSKRVTRNFLLQRRGDRRPFSDRDRDVLDILQPHLRALYERAAVRRRATAALSRRKHGEVQRFCRCGHPHVVRDESVEHVAELGCCREMERIE
jgi:hypothetical protein